MSRRRFLLCACLAGAALLSGCDGTSSMDPALDGSTLVSLDPAGYGDEGWPSDPSSEAEPGMPPLPDGGMSPGPRTDLGAPRGPITLSSELAELKNVYGVTLGGNYSDAEIRQALIAARQYRPTETRRVTINFFLGESEATGAGGVYIEDPALETPGANNIVEMYTADQHVVLHELTHHVTLYPENEQTGKQRAQDVTASIAGFPTAFEARYLPSEYALTDEAEFWAEFFSYLRETEKGMVSPALEQDLLPTFNPPEEVRVIARREYAN